jgi:two-component system, NarL family, response regulator YdfI
VLIAARSAFRQAGFEKMLAGTSEFRTVGICAGMVALEERARQLAPDLVVVDWDAQSGAAELTTALGQVAANIATLVLVDDPPPDVTAELLVMGVKAVIQRDSSFDALTSALRASAEGLTVLGTEAAKALAERLPRSSGMTRLMPAEELTDRELEVLRLLAEGIGNREIAARLGISEHTVKFHISSILGKLSASNRTEAVAHGIDKD